MGEEAYLDLSNINISTPALLSKQAFPILKGLSPLSLRILNASSRLIHVSKGVEILHEGDFPRDLYFIKEGRVSISKESGQQKKTLSYLQKGHVYGEFGVLRNKLRYASVYTTDNSEIIRIDASAVQQVLDADQSFKEALNTILSQRMLNSFFFSHPIFQMLPEDLRIQLSRTLTTISHPRDSRLFTQGDTPNGIILIISGTAEVYCLDSHQQESLLEIRRDDDVLGELATKEGEKLAYSAIAASDLDVLELHAQQMKQIRQVHPETFKRLEVYIHKRAQRTASRIKEQAY